MAMWWPAHRELASSARTRSTAFTFTTILRSKTSPTEVEVGVAGPGEAVAAGVRAAPVGIDGPLERHAAGTDDAIDDCAGVDVEELHPPELPRSDVTLDEGLVGKKRLLGLIGLDPPPHRSHYNEHTFAPGQRWAADR